MPSGGIQVGIGIGPPTDATRPNGLDIAGLGGADVLLLDAAGNAVALPSLPRMVLGLFTFAVNPSSLSFTEPPTLALHSPPGGSPRYQWMGRGECRMSLRGKFSGDTAIADMVALRALNGTRVPFSYGIFSSGGCWVRVDFPSWNRDDDIDYNLNLAIENLAVTPGGAPSSADSFTFSGSQQPAQAAGQAATGNPPAQQPPTVSYVVVTGDTLYTIAQKKYGDGGLFPVIARLNSIEDARLLQIGVTLQLPSDRQAARTLKAQQDAQIAALPNDQGTGSLAQLLLGAP